jgi:hypothetical protein
MDFREISLKNILHQQHLVHLPATLHRTLIL